MKKKMTDKAIRFLMLFIYIGILFLYFIVNKIYYKLSVQELEYILVIIILLAIGFVLITLCKEISNKWHGVILSVFLLPIYICSLCRKDFYLIYIGVLITAIIICIYELRWLLQYVLIYSAIICYIVNLYQIFELKNEINEIAIYALGGILILLIELILVSMMDHLEQYKKMITINSMDAQEMLKVVEIKRQEAQNAAKAKSMFLSNMSHEIRTPINAILGMDEIILRESNESNVIDYANRIQSAGNTLLSLINDILDFSKIESGKMEINEEEYKFEELTTDIYNILSLRMEEKGLALKLEIAEDIPSVLFGDVLRIKQIMLNVLINAVKYTQKGYVSLKIDWRQKQTGIIKLIIQVEDTGIGIKPENQKKLFDAFERLDGDTTKHIEGTGLGMSITKNLLDLMSGTISVSSEYNVGSIFTIEVEQKVIDYKPMGKIITANHKNVFGLRYTESFLAPDAKILIVDDNEMNLLVVKGLLKKTLIQIDIAISGMQCLDMVKREKYQIIFMDHMMPEMDGVDTFHKMATLEGNLNIGVPVVALTANAVSGAKEMYMEMGFADYISKPINSHVIENMIKNMLPENMVEMTQIQENEEVDYYDITGIVDYKKGLLYAGNDKKQYEENLRVFIKSMDERQELLEKYIEQQDWKAFEIEVHALKSNAAYIGAKELSVVAAEQEKYAKAFNGAAIVHSWEKLEELWDQTVAALYQFVDMEEVEQIYPNGKTLTDEQYLEFIQKIIQHMNNFESDRAMFYLKKILEYDMPEEKRSRIKKSYEELDKFNYRQATQILLDE